MQYKVIIEKEPSSDFGAWVPDLPGCVATAQKREEVERLIREAVPFHLEGIREDGDPIPDPRAAAIVVDVAA